MNVDQISVTSIDKPTQITRYKVKQPLVLYLSSYYLVGDPQQLSFSRAKVNELNKSPFTFGEVPQGYGNLVQLLAVLGPAMRVSKLTFDRKLVYKRVVQLRHMVHMRIAQLHALGWCRTNGSRVGGYGRRLWFIANCQPTFIMTTTTRMPCNVVQFCPFCWARKAAEQWRRIDAAFFGDSTAQSGELTRGVQLRGATNRGRRPPRRTEFDLVERVQEWDMPYAMPEKGITDGFGLWWQLRTASYSTSEWRRKSELAHLASLVEPGMQHGVFEHVRFAPAAGKPAWTIRANQVWLMPAGVPLIEPFEKVPWRRKSRRTVLPRRRDVARAVARAFHYPRFLIDPEVDPALVLAALNARGKHRLSESYGTFRGRIAGRD